MQNHRTIGLITILAGTAGCMAGDELPTGSAGELATTKDAMTYQYVPPNPGEKILYPCIGELEVTYVDSTYGPTDGTITYPGNGAGSCGLAPIGGGSVVLFLTGAGFSLSDYTHVTEHLARRGYLVIAVDAPESLPTQHCGGALHCAEDRAEQSVRFAEWWLSTDPIAAAYDTNRISVVGHSRGGEASFFAARYIRDSGTLDAQVPAIVALAPSDTPLVLATVDASDASSVLVVAATRDEDVPTFQPYGLYERLGTEFGSESPGEISTLDRVERALITLEHANHRQFSNLCGMPPGQCAGTQLGLMPCDIQHSVTRGLVSAWLDWQVEGHDPYRRYFDGTIDRPLLHPLGTSEPEADLRVMYDPGRPHGTRVIDNFEDGDIATSTDAGSVALSGVTGHLVEGSTADATFRHRTVGRRFLSLSDIGDPMDSVEWGLAKGLRSTSSTRPWSDFTTLSLRAARIWSESGSFANEAPVLRVRLRMKDGALGGNTVDLPPLHAPAIEDADYSNGAVLQCGGFPEQRSSFFRSLRVPLSRFDSRFEPVDWTQVRGMVLMVDDPALADETLFIDSVALTGGTEYLSFSPQ